MNELPPEIAAKVAQDVYTLTKSDTLEDALLTLNNKYKGILEFPFSEKNLLKGKTGGPFYIKSRTAFGFVLIGKGFLEGHVLILFRGTQYLADWVTNLNAMVSSSAVGQPVHDGFNQAFKSMESQVNDFMGRLTKYNIHTINCIGHSLGGAIATICGEWIQKNYKRVPKIYTFGSPRVGLYSFSSMCTNNVGSQNIYRAHHTMDVVTCIPIWPFYHVPLIGTDYRLESPGSMYSVMTNHDMFEYVKSVSGKSWQQLSGMYDSNTNDASIENWLNDEASTGLNLLSIEWLSKALIYVIRKVFDGAAWLLSKTFSTTFTLMDQLAYVLKKGLDLAENVSSWVVALVKKIMRMLGMGLHVDIAEMTTHFIRYVLQNLQERVNRHVRQVLDNVLVNGRAI